MPFTGASRARLREPTCSIDPGRIDCSACRSLPGASLTAQQVSYRYVCSDIVKSTNGTLSEATMSGPTRHRWRVAIVGAGHQDFTLRLTCESQCDGRRGHVRAPAWPGAWRYGVAPDHAERRQVIGTGRLARQRSFSGCTKCRDWPPHQSRRVTAALCRHLCSGAITDRHRDSWRGSAGQPFRHGIRSWYNGHRTSSTANSTWTRNARW
jgi:hypothetical protein